mmetsp:Transcript_13068/g.30409  ORF Transcript_13068/g.30409 Transcript_13068/m.30409 type:complete len:257 (+) Transcript_13068:259-1029(+)
MITSPSSLTSSFTTSTSSSSPLNSSFSNDGLNPDSMVTPSVDAWAGNPSVSPRRFQKITWGTGHGTPHACLPVSSNRRTSRSWSVSHSTCDEFQWSRAWSNCMSLKTIRSGMSSGDSFACTAVCNISSMAFSKSVLPPHGACCVLATFSAMLIDSSITTHEGCSWKVRMRWANTGEASSLTRIDRAIETSIGVPYMDPETSAMATNFPRSTLLPLSAAPLVSPPGRRTLSMASWTDMRIASHWSCIRSFSEMLVFA